jgi:hypothetical protein
MFCPALTDIVLVGFHYMKKADESFVFAESGEYRASLFGDYEPTQRTKAYCG